MRISCLFGRTLRTAPVDAETASHQLLLRAGFIRSLGPGRFAYLPLAWRSVHKIVQIVRNEMEALGGQEFAVSLYCSDDRSDAEGTFSSHTRVREDERDILSLVRMEIRSYRDLPSLLYQVRVLRDDNARPRRGLISARESIEWVGYGLSADQEGFGRQYHALRQACQKVFRRCGLPVVTISAEIEPTEQAQSDKFMYRTPVGEEIWLACEQCGYVAEQRLARFQRVAPPAEVPRPLERVATPGSATIRELASSLGLPSSKTAKAVFRVAVLQKEQAEVEQFVFAVVRGDTELSEPKLAHVLGAVALRPARDEEIRALGIVPGYASPIGIRGSLVVVDEWITLSPNLVAGANEEGYHLLNTNYGRDYRADIVADIAQAEEGFPCPECAAQLRRSCGVEVGHLSEFGRHSTGVAACTFIDQEGQPRPVVMSVCRLEISRLLACLAEEHHDTYGLCWPITVAPYSVYLVTLPGNEGVAEQLETALESAGIEVLYDDRNERAGVKFNDADLIGVPIRITVSRQAWEAGGFEVKLRHSPEKIIVPQEQIVAYIQSQIESLYAALST